MRSDLAKPAVLGDGATVAVVGGGPAGAFFTIHLLKLARRLGRRVRVVVFERRRQSADCAGAGPAEICKGCTYCAGGISPRLNEELEALGLPLPAEVIQNRIESITIQGYWKNIEVSVPQGREMLSVFRGGRPARRQDRQHSFDALLLDSGIKQGAELIAGEVHQASYSALGKPVLGYRVNGEEAQLEADFAVFAGGVNEGGDAPGNRPTPLQLLQALQPAYVPPRVRKTLIFELEAPPNVSTTLEGELHFVEYGSQTLQLEMCSLLPKRGYITVVLVGPCVDASTGPAENLKIIQRFLALPHVRKLVPPQVQLRLSCICNPRLVTGTAKIPFGERVAAVGDMATARLYKDGILSAHHTARALAEALLTQGLDFQSLKAGYGPVIARFRRDNRFAACVFLLHRVLFSSSVLSRVLYQAVISERKEMPASDRRLEDILWRIASGDDEYETIFKALLRPVTLWRILVGGACITLRNWLTELFFGLNWEGFGRFTTGVAKEQFDAKRQVFARALAESGSSAIPELEFERMYTIHIRASRAAILEQLSHFGEEDRGYLHPRWVRIRRMEGRPNEPGCVIRYELFGGTLAFSLELERVAGGHLVEYHVRDGFAQGGVLLFEIEPAPHGTCNLSIYLAFDFARGGASYSRPFWWLFRYLFPEFVHDVIWNHSLCELKNLAEAAEVAAPKQNCVRSAA